VKDATPPRSLLRKGGKRRKLQFAPVTEEQPGAGGDEDKQPDTDQKGGLDNHPVHPREVRDGERTYLQQGEIRGSEQTLQEPDRQYNSLRK